MKKIRTSAIGLCFWSIALQAQIDSTAIHYASTITANELNEHLHIIAADDYEGRETGYDGQRKCEAYLIAQYQQMGLPEVNGSYTQEFDLYLNDPSRVEVNANGNEYTFLKDFYYYPATDDRTITSPLIFAGYGIDEEGYRDVDLPSVKDRIVIILSGEPMDDQGNYLLSGTKEASAWTTDGEKKKLLLEKNGAAAVVILYEDYDKRKKRVEGYFSHKTMSLAKDKEEVKGAMPVIHASLAMGQSMLGVKSWKKGMKALRKRKPINQGTSQAEIVFKRKESRLTSSNVMGYIEGKEKREELVVITAHYDHIGVDGEEVYNGADDDGSGTVATLEIAEAFAAAKAEGHGPQRSVLIVNVSGEEKGLLGSQYYVENPVFPLENTVADLNIDMIGRVDEQHKGNENYVYIIGADRISQDLHDIGEAMNKNYCGLELDYTFNAEEDPNRFYYRSDHYNFAKNGVPSVFYFSGVHEDYHQPGDTVDKIMFEKLERITKLVFHTAWELANRPERPIVNP